MTIHTNNKQNIWTLITNFLQFFILTYFFFYMFPYPLGNIPIINDIFSYYDKAIEFLTIWLGENILYIEKVEKIEMTGSGDTTFDYVKLFTTVVIALFVSILIFCFTSSTASRKVFMDITFIYLRYYLALCLLSYGFAKFYEGQFIFPDVSRLEHKIGDASPMGLLWTFMGYSKSYTFFAGLCEVLGGILLFFRRTTILGGLISFMVMINVVMLNFAYDVPVKLFSSHLALISIYIISPNIINLFQFFFFNKTTSLKIDKLKLRNKWLKYSRIVVKSLVIIGFPTLSIITDLSYVVDMTKHNLYGGYITEEFIRNNDTILVTQNDTTRWNKFFITEYSTKVILANDKRLRFTADIDTLSKIISLVPDSDSTVSYKLKYNFINDKTFTLKGKFQSDSISVKFKVKRLNDYELVKRDFNWISEYPYNR